MFKKSLILSITSLALGATAIFNTQDVSAVKSEKYRRKAAEELQKGNNDTARQYARMAIQEQRLEELEAQSRAARRVQPVGQPVLTAPLVPTEQVKKTSIWTIIKNFFSCKKVDDPIYDQQAEQQFVLEQYNQLREGNRVLHTILTAPNDIDDAIDDEAELIIQGIQKELDMEAGSMPEIPKTDPSSN